MNISDKLYRFLMVVCAALLLHPIAYIILRLISPSFAFLSFPAAFVPIGTGFVLQALFSFFTGNRPALYESRKSLLYEHTGFSVGKALVPIGLSFSAAAAIFIFLSGVLEKMHEAGELDMHRGYAAYPSYAAMFFFAFAVVGIFLWFVSFEDATEQNMIAAYFVIFFIQYTASFFIEKIPEEVMGISALLFFCVFLFLSNKNLLDKRTQTKGGVSVISKNAQTVNRTLVVVCIGAVICVIAVMKTLLSFLKGVIAVFFGGLAEMLFRESDAPGNIDYSTAPGSGSGYLPVVFSDRSLDIIAPVITFLFVVAGIALVILYRRKLLEPLLMKLSEMIKAFLEFIKRPYQKKKNVMPAELKSFRDEMSPLSGEDERGFTMPDEYSSFLRRLSTLNTYDEKLRFSYAVFIRLIRKKDETIKVSDTPRKIASMARNKRYAELKELCEIFELEEYALIPQSEERRERALDSLVRLVKLYI